jgi:hypothetical protein
MEIHMSNNNIGRFIGGVAFAIAALFSTLAFADDSRGYSMSSVTEVTSVRTKPGMFDEYVKFLAGPFRQEQEELKKLGIVTDYTFFGASPRAPHDPDLYIVVTYKNMAALDALDEKDEMVMKKVFGSVKQAEKGQIDRESIREILGSQLIRELKLK